MSAPVRPTSALGFRPPRVTTQQHPMTSSVSSSNSNLASGTAESTLLDENGLPLIGHLLAFTPDVIQAFQDAAKLIEESREIKKQAMNQIKDAFNDAKAYSLTVNQSVAQKLADIITLAVRDLLHASPLDRSLLATFDDLTRGEQSGTKSSRSLVRFDDERSTIERWSAQLSVLQDLRASRSADYPHVSKASRQPSARSSRNCEGSLQRRKHRSIDWSVLSLGNGQPAAICRWNA